MSRRLGEERSVTKLVSLVLGGEQDVGIRCGRDTPGFSLNLTLSFLEINTLSGALQTLIGVGWVNKRMSDRDPGLGAPSSLLLSSPGSAAGGGVGDMSIWEPDYLCSNPGLPCHSQLCDLGKLPSLSVPPFPHL